MLCADPVMDTDQPRLEISENEMDNGQELLGHFEIHTFRNGLVLVAAFPQAGVTAPIVRDDQRPRSDGAIDKPTKRFGATVSGNCQPNAPRIAPILSLVLRGSRLPMAHLNGAGDALVDVCVNRIGKEFSISEIWAREPSRDRL